ncbi:hypothetical protein [Bradyrhizobium sp. CB3481]|uniref:hypothetical protein n=1 Tax=Bradyrhizobium sp. CB3481 TaxID=3039158 RepID=UPI0024B0D292|nr:hypothetical protein [Bradyrhizobium sp. CB3481]WFU14803.1 hypothetical protein QA643_27605 [Bradyrhizobium sp. CB3481]
MFDSESTALLQAVLNEVCKDVSLHEAGARTHVASKVLEVATGGKTCVDALKQVGRTALISTPTMWR